MSCAFYVVEFNSSISGRAKSSPIFWSITSARRWARFFRTVASNVRIIRGGTGGVEVE